MGNKLNNQTSRNKIQTNHKFKYPNFRLLVIEKDNPAIKNSNKRKKGTSDLK